MDYSCFIVIPAIIFFRSEKIQYLFVEVKINLVFIFLVNLII